MANELQFQPYQLPSTATNIPQAYNQDYFNTLQSTLGNEQQNQGNNLLGFQQSHGLARPGETNTALLGQVLGSPQQQINSEILPQALGASALGQGQQFQNQMQQIQFQQQLQSMQQAFQEQEQLINLYHSLMPQGYRQSFGQEFGTGLAKDIGSMGPMLAASAAFL